MPFSGIRFPPLFWPYIYAMLQVLPGLYKEFSVMYKLLAKWVIGHHKGLVETLFPKFSYNRLKTLEEGRLG